MKKGEGEEGGGLRPTSWQLSSGHARANANVSSLSRAPFALQKCCSVSEMDPSPPSNNNAEGSSAAPGAAGSAVPPAGASGGGCPTVHCNVESKLSFNRGCKDDGERSDHYCAWLASQRSKGE